MDLLKKAFTSYTKLLNIEYSFIVLHTGCMASSAEKKFGAKINKNLIQEIYLKFEKNSFFHFTGLRHAKNSTLSAYDRNYKTIAQFYDDVCNDKITYDEIEKIKDVDPDNKNYIDQRLQLIIDAEKLIDESNSLREYDGFLYKLNEKPKEKLQSANCIIQSGTKIYPKIFYFFSLNSVSDIPSNKPQIQAYCCNACSIGFNENEDYSNNHKLITIIIKKKYLSINKEETLYLSPTYLLKHTDQIEEEKDYLISHPDYLATLLNHKDLTESIKNEIKRVLN